MTEASDTVKFVVPDSIRHLIEKQMDHLDPARATPSRSRERCGR